MANSIFLTVKKSLGVSEADTTFDDEILLATNTAIMTLLQLGIGPETGLVITGADEQWHQLIGTSTDYEGVKTYICLNARLIFDPPGNSFVLDSINRIIKELEWRLNAQYETDLTKPTPTTE